MNAYLWALVTACIWGVVPVLEKLGMAKINPFVALFYRCMGVIIGFIILSLFVVKGQDIRAVDAKAIGLLIVSGFLASFAAQMTFYHGLKIGEVSKVVPVSASYYLVTFILAIFIFKEAVTLSKVAGVLLITAGMWLIR